MEDKIKKMLNMQYILFTGILIAITGSFFANYQAYMQPIRINQFEQLVATRHAQQMDSVLTLLAQADSANSFLLVYKDNYEKQLQTISDLERVIVSYQLTTVPQNNPVVKPVIDPEVLKAINKLKK